MTAPDKTLTASTALRSVPESEHSPGLLRTPPHNPEAERGLLGCILVNNASYDRVCDYLLPEHFSQPVCGRIYEVMAKMIQNGAPVTPVSLRSFVERDQLVMDAGGMRFLVSLANSMVTPINAGEYGKLIFELYQLRRVIDIGEGMVNDAFDVRVDHPAAAIIESAEQGLFDVASTGASKSRMVTYAQAVQEAMAMAEAAHRLAGEITGVPTGLRDLDAKMGGLHPSDLVILAGRPSMGKSTLAMNIAENAARFFATTERPEYRGKHVAVFSLEMSRAQLAMRGLARAASVDSHHIRNGTLAHEDFEKLLPASVNLSELPLHIDDQPAIGFNMVRTRARRLSRARGSAGVGLIVIDYLQMLTAREAAKDGRVQEVSAITRGLKAVAKDLGVPVVALSQLSRALENRDDKRPQLADLRESGTIEQDADVVLFAYREQYYLEKNPPAQRAEESGEKFSQRQMAWQQRMEACHNVAEVIIGKQRHGPLGTIRVHFSGPHLAFSDLDQHHGGDFAKTAPMGQMDMGV